MRLPLPSLHQLQRRAKAYKSDEPKGDRSQIFGTRTFGSGYSENSKPGTSEHPFIFWPIAWLSTVGGDVPNSAYLHSNENKYGNATNPSRPGGPMMISAISSGATNFTMISDNYTVRILAQAITINCASFLSASFIANSTANIVAYSDSPQPDQVVEYYRSSSITLASDAYQNNATYSAKGTPDTELPDLPGLDCFNATIGSSAPLNIESPNNLSKIVLAGLLPSIVVIILCVGGYHWYSSKDYKARKPRVI